MISGWITRRLATCSTRWPASPRPKFPEGDAPVFSLGGCALVDGVWAAVGPDSLTEILGMLAAVLDGALPYHFECEYPGDAELLERPGCPVPQRLGLTPPANGLTVARSPCKESMMSAYLACTTRRLRVSSSVSAVHAAGSRRYRLTCWTRPGVRWRRRSPASTCGPEASAASGVTRNTNAVPAVERGQRGGQGRSERPKMYVACLASRGLQVEILSPLLAVAQTEKASGRRLARNLEGMTVAATLFRFEDSYAREVPGLSVPWTAASAPAPGLLMLNEELAVELGVDPAELREPPGVALLAGQAPEGVTTVAQAYAGHQFGGYSPRLGDGRALLLGEVINTQGRRRDLHVKGSGRTPFSRGADGKAVVGPMLREYVIGEAMHGLGIPTTRALAVVATGEQVLRERALPGAVLTRVAASHLRVGTFQYAAASGDRDLLCALAGYAIARHYPAAAGAPNRYLDLYRRVVEAQAWLVARWMLVGFVHSSE